MSEPAPHPNLPESVTKFMDGVVRRVSWRAKVREEVRRELLDHFEDALSPCENTADRELRGRQLVEDFGDATLLTTLIRRGKSRCRPPWIRALLSTAKIFTVLFAVCFTLDFVLSHRAAGQLQDALEELRNGGAVTSMQELMSRAQKSREEATAAARGTSPGCPATAALLALDSKHIDPALVVDWESLAQKPVRERPIGLKDMDADTWESWNPQVEAEARAKIDRTQEALATVRRLADLPLDNFGEVIQFLKSNYVSGIRIPDLLGSRMAANLLAVDALLAVKDGRPDAALDDATTVLKMTRHISNACEGLIGTMIICAIRKIIVLQGIVEPALNETDFSEEAESRFVEALANMEDLAKQLSLSLEWDRLAWLDMLQRGFSGNWYFEDDSSRRLADLLDLRARLFPFWNDADAIRLLKLYNSSVEVASLPYPEFAKRIPTFSAELDNTPVWLAPPAKWMTENILRSKILVTNCEVRGDLARLAFALRRYKLAHGAYPAALSSLVPDFVRELPADRFTSKPLLYRAEGNGCIIYSAGSNGQDDGGVKPAGGPNAIAEGDIIWTLKR